MATSCHMRIQIRLDACKKVGDLVNIILKTVLFLKIQGFLVFRVRCYQSVPQPHDQRQGIIARYPLLLWTVALAGAVAEECNSMLHTEAGPAIRSPSEQMVVICCYQAARCPC